MGDGWRNRFMAPVYALGISFLFVFVLGFAFDGPTVIRFKPPQPEQSDTPTVLGRIFVVVFAAKQDDLIVAGTRVGPGEFSFPSPDEDVRVCLDVPSGWSVASPPQTSKIGDLECLPVKSNEDKIDVLFSGRPVN